MAVILLPGLAFLLARSYAPELVPLSCSQAIPAGQAQKLWDDNQQTVQAIRAVKDSAGHITINLDTAKCPGRAFLNILFDTADGRKKVQQLLDQSPLKSIPVEWHNA